MKEKENFSKINEENNESKNYSNEEDINTLQKIHLSKSLNPKNTKLNFTDNSKKSKNEDYIIKKTKTAA